jgi:hypothetical protein
MSSSPDRFSLLFRYRWPIILLSILLFLFISSGARYLVLDDNYRIFFHPDNPHLQALDALEETYAKEEVILFVMTPEDGNAFSKKTLGIVEELSEKAWQIPFSTRVDSITNVQYSYAAEDDIVVEALVPDASLLDTKEIERVKEIALTDPLIAQRLVSKEGHVTVVVVTMVLPGQEGGGERTAPVEFSRNLKMEFEEKYPGLRIRLTGGGILSNMFTEYTEKDLATLTPLMYLVIFLAMGLTLRSISGTIAGVIIVLMSVGTAMGLAGWLNLHLTATSSGMPTIVMTLAIADSIHIMVMFLHEMRSGKTKEAALRESLRVNYLPVFITSITTIGGFLILNFSSVPPLVSFGNMCAMGIAAAYLYSVILLPALLSVLPFKVATGIDLETRGMNRLSEWVIANRTVILIVTASSAIGLSLMLPRLDFRNNWVNWFDDRTEFRQDLYYVEANLTGSNAMEFSMPASGPGGISDPEYLNTLSRFTEWVRTNPHVHHVSTLADIVKRLNKNMHADREEYYTIPEDPELVAQYLLLYEMSLPYGQDLNNQINVDRSATRVLLVTADIDSKEVNDLKLACENWLQKNAPPYMGTAQGTGNAVMFASIAEDTIRTITVSTPIALLAISALLVFMFRSVRYGIVSIIPNIVPVAMAFGLWSILVGRVNFGLACVAGMSIGIVVDDTVHFMSKYLRARREHGYDAQDSIRYAFRSIGKAMVSTSVILILGFTVMGQSVFKFNANMGMLTTLCIGFALVTDLLLLPALLLLIDGKPKAVAQEIGGVES